MNELRHPLVRLFVPAPRKSKRFAFPDWFPSHGRLRSDILRAGSLGVISRPGDSEQYRLALPPDVATLERRARRREALQPARWIPPFLLLCVVLAILASAFGGGR